MDRKSYLVLLLVASLIFALLIGCTPAEKTPAEQTESDGSDPDTAAFPGFESIHEAAVTENWSQYFPKQHEYWLATERMIRTTYGGGGRAEAEDLDVDKINYLEMYPFLRVNYQGFPFEKGYYRSRGHYYALTDVIDTERLPDWGARPGACLSCKSTDVVVLIEEQGDDWYIRPFQQVLGEQTIGCLNCHDHNDASVKIQHDYLFDGLAHETYKHTDVNDTANLTCAQCHINYHFNKDTRKVTPPWSVGLTVEDQLAHYDADRRSDEWEHPITGALVAKIQHPEFELYNEGRITNIHKQLGLGCIDCHMPIKEAVDGEQYSSHTWTTPFATLEESCLGCHANWGEAEVIERAELAQGKVYEKQNRIGEELAEFIQTVGRARETGNLTTAQLSELQEIHREAQFYWDFIWVENSNGFHNWDEAHRVLDNADALIQQGMDLIP